MAAINTEKSINNKFNARGNLFLKFEATSLYWMEKGLILLDIFQIFGLMWNMAQPWPWPYLWVKWTQILMWANLDYFSTTSEGALVGRTSALDISKWGQMTGYLNYSLYLCILPAIVLLCLAASWPLYNVYGKRWDIYRGHSIRYTLLLLQMLYVPSSLALFRLFYCENGFLSADPTVTCASSKHITYAVVCSFLVLPLYVLLPVVLYRYIKDLLVYELNSDHEKRLQVWELTYIIDTDMFWKDAQVWIISSFKCSSAYFRVHFLLYKAAILIIFIAFRTSAIAQASVLWFLTAFFVVFIGADRPYRAKSSNMILFVLLSALLVDSTAGLLNACKVENAALVSSKESIWLLTYHVLGLAVIATICFMAIWKPFDQWPVQRTLSRCLTSTAKKKVVRWIRLLQEATSLRIYCVKTPVECIDFIAIEDVVRRLRACWVVARSNGSIFEVPLSEALEDLLRLHVTLAPIALRKVPVWDEAYEQLRGTLPVSRRSKCLMTEKKRRLLTKLMTIRAFIGNKEDFREPRGGAPPSPAADRQQGERKEKRSVRFAISPTLDSSEGPKLPGTAEEEEDVAVTRMEISRMIALSEELLHRFGMTPDDESLWTGLTDLYVLWNESIQMFEAGAMPGAEYFNANEVEDWYIYRKAVFDRLQRAPQPQGQTNASARYGTAQGQGQGFEGPIAISPSSSAHTVRRDEEAYSGVRRGGAVPPFEDAGEADATELDDTFDDEDEQAQILRSIIVIPDSLRPFDGSNNDVPGVVELDAMSAAASSPRNQNTPSALQAKTRAAVVQTPSPREVSPLGDVEEEERGVDLEAGGRSSSYRDLGSADDDAGTVSSSKAASVESDNYPLARRLVTSVSINHSLSIHRERSLSAAADDVIFGKEDTVDEHWWQADPDDPSNMD